ALPILAAVADGVAPDHVGADLLLAPALTARGEDCFELVLVAGFVLPVGGEVVPADAVLAQGEAHAFGVVDQVVLDDPSLGPSRSDQPWLVRGGRGPRARGVRHLD